MEILLFQFQLISENLKFLLGNFSVYSRRKLWKYLANLLNVKVINVNLKNDKYGFIELDGISVREIENKSSSWRVKIKSLPLSTDKYEYSDKSPSISRNTSKYPDKLRVHFIRSEHSATINSDTDQAGDSEELIEFQQTIRNIPPLE